MSQTQIETTSRHDTVVQEAQDLYSRQPDWVTFYREVLGLNGLLRRTFNTPGALAEFEQTEEYPKIQQMVARLRKKDLPYPTEEEPTRVITVRLPKSLHEALRVEAHEHCTSMNKLCISKLLQFIDGKRVPSDG